MLNRKIAKRTGAVATAMAAVLGAGVLTAAPATASTGNGTCASTELCVYDATYRDASKGYYDLGSPPDANFHGKYWYRGDNGYIGDDISSATGGSATSCAGYDLFSHVNFEGLHYRIAKGYYVNYFWGDNNGGSPDGKWNLDNEFSSHSKYSC